ncbi:hypothetical protein ACFXPW_33375 [Streptomyces goshikiensis]|uniref:hypothetical protein n=1 Tax=Streptomyces goshikiensis TaxID=1942 RepID=UPI0036786898
MKITRAQMHREAEYLETVAIPRAEAAAADGDRAAADPGASDYARSVASHAAGVARQHADEFAGFAAALRDGEIPDGLDLT